MNGCVGVDGVDGCGSELDPPPPALLPDCPLEEEVSPEVDDEEDDGISWHADPSPL